jgi:hypothetical protein
MHAFKQNEGMDINNNLSSDLLEFQTETNVDIKRDQRLWQ